MLAAQGLGTRLGTKAMELISTARIGRKSTPAQQDLSRWFTLSLVLLDRYSAVYDSNSLSKFDVHGEPRTIASRF